ncbi:MAG: glutamate-5-semialdehyde dehydrogenase [Bacteroidota bacterium]
MNSLLPHLAQVRKSSRSLRKQSDHAKQQLLHRLAELVLAHESAILAANQLDLDRMPDTDPKKDRLRLTPERIQGLVASVRAIADLPDPTGQVHLQRELQPGLQLQKVSVPLGVVGIIYESRPNVTIDVAALCLRSGNGVVLRGGSDAEHSNIALVQIIHQAMQESGGDSQALYLMPTDRALVQELLTADRYVDILIPRGSQALIDFVRANATVPTIETGAGVCHTYVHAAADLAKAAAIVVNAKTSRPSVCNALDTVVVDQAVAKEFLPLIVAGFQQHGVEVFADSESHAIFQELGYPSLQQAKEADFGREYLDFKCSVKVVEGPEAALEHIHTFSSRHSEAIVSEDAHLCERFLAEIDAAAVYANASTRFTDGGEFGLGAEIGISTQKLHARGPFALEKLVTEKWVVRGNGQVR